MVILLGLNSCDFIWDKVVDEPLTDLLERIPGFEKTDPDEQEGDFHGPLFVKDTWFGMGSNTHMRSQDIARDYKEMANLGVRFVREDIPWQEIQVSNYSYNLDYRGGILQEALIEAERNGLEVVGILAYGPGENVSYSNKAEFISLWAGYVQKVVDRFGDYIDYWEVGNEVNTWWNKVRPDKTRFEAIVYSEMLYKAYTIIKEADSTDTVILSSLVNIDKSSQGLDPFQALSEMGSAQPGNYCDAIALHLYWPGRDPDEAIRTLVRGRETYLTMEEYVKLFITESDRILGQRKPIWITEVGYDFEQMGPLMNRYGLKLEDLQATMLIKSYVTLLSIPEVQGVFWYTWHNDETGQYFNLLEAGKNAYGTLSTVLAGSQALGRQPVVDVNGNEVESGMDYRFRRTDGKVVSYFWAMDDSLSDVVAKLVPGDNQTVKMYYPDQFLRDQANFISSPEDFVLHMGPGVMIGAIAPDAKIVVGETNKVLAEYARMPIHRSGSYFDDEEKYFYLTYSTALWDQVEYNYGSEPYYRLVLKQEPSCFISGFSAADGGDISLRSSEVEFYGETYSILTYSNSNDGQELFELITRGKPNEYNEKGRVQMSLDFNKMPHTCREFFWDVIELSQKDNFGLGSVVGEGSSSVDMGGGFTLFYNPDLWKIDDSPFPSLINRANEKCVIRYFFGHGMDPEIYDVVQTDFKIGKTNVNNVKWILKENGYLSLEGYYFHFMNRNQEIQVYAGADENSDSCSEAVLDVLTVSEAKDFGLSSSENLPPISKLKLAPMILGGRNLFLTYETNVWDVFTWSPGSDELFTRDVPNCRLETFWSACNPHDNKHDFEISYEQFAGEEIKVKKCTQRDTGNRVGKVYTIKLDGGTWTIVAHGYSYDTNEELPLSDACIQAADRVIELSVQNGFNE